MHRGDCIGYDVKVWREAIWVIQIAAFWLFIAPQAFSGSIWLDFDENAKKSNLDNI